MKYVVVVLLSIMLNLSLHSQNSDREMLLNKADSLDKSKNYKASLPLWENLKTSNKEGDVAFYTARYLYAKGGIEIENNNVAGAVSIFEQAIPFISKIKVLDSNKKFISEFYSDLYLSTGFSGNWEKALNYAKTGYDFTAKNLPKDKDLINFVQDQGYILKQLRRYEESIIAYEKALKLAYKFYAKDYFRLGIVHNGLATAYSDLHFHNQSLYHYTKALEFHKKSNDIDKSYVVSSSNNTIWENLSYGDEKQAKIVLDNLNSNFSKWYAEEGFASKTKRGDKIEKEHYKMLKYLSNLRYNNKINKNNFAKNYLDSVVLVFDKLPEDYKPKLYEPMLLARFDYEDVFYKNNVLDENQINQHIAFNKKTLELARKYNSKHDELVACLKLAKVYNKYEKFEEALDVIEEGKKISENFFNASRFTIEILEATILNSQNKTNQSKTKLLKTYQDLLKDETKVATLTNLKYSHFKKFNSDTFIRNIINSATLYFLMYEKDKKKEDLIIAHNLFFIASDMFNEFYLKGKYNYSLNIFNKEISAGLLKTQLLIDPNDKSKIKVILNRIENNSSQHLWNIFEVKNSQNLKVPPSLIRNLNELVFEKNAIEQQLKLSKDNKELKNKLVDLDKNITKIKASINEKDQSYETFKSGNFSIDAIQKKLSTNQLMIKYVVTEKEVYAFAIKNSSIELVNLGEAASIKKIVNQQLKQVNSIDGNYAKTGKLLYEKIVHPMVKNQSVDAIIFVPEDFLNLVSFESLSNKNGQMLVQNFHTSYAYSIKLWDILQTDKKEGNDLNRFVSFAPNYAKIPTENQMRGLLRADLFDLAEAKKEAKKISDLFNGKLYLNEEANRKNFLQATTDFSFHHLAMHSLMEEDYAKSSLVFSDNQKVLFDELYQLNFPSKLVVLSACNTGIGSMESGEGMMSLSRALTYSGVKSSVYSLWQVPDKETSEIMISFYENLKEGQSKDEALANAKRDFIENNPMKNHPFYWAGFVVNGDVSPILESTNWWLYIGIGLAIGLLIFLFRKKLF
ncbi:CHAT domain-containing protein [Flavobacterium azooxidireducens]|uniref:CHAT domain-containing protein n=1 Tax=Flavobacterium azooxidireducens TaxID=1871076 RepID=A0ABY4KN06_9FLAO|nr:CHAT domain-containing tetratricopeptide repeat protein [Flavobacterium azooxidireducens]UPQ80785.1 CHAT domain-containing protein [Flavobacterium azooxidireducens]